MTADAFLLAFQRFVGRRGIPQTIYTDNGQTFQAANKELAHLWETIAGVKTHYLFAHTGITWKFIAPRAAWWGGWWERMVGTMKRCLRKVLGKTLATDEDLRTIPINIEAVLNSRPITQDEDALTPAHFLCGANLPRRRGPAMKALKKPTRGPPKQPMIFGGGRNTYSS
jgi:hypothetical protein